MSKKTDKPATPAVPAEELPAIVKAAPELLPLYDWWRKEGKSTLTWFLGALAVVCIVMLVKQHLRARDAEGGAALARMCAPSAMESPEGLLATADFIDAADANSSSKAAYALKLRLAKRYYEERDFEGALAGYDALAGTVPATDPFYGFAEAGRAHALEEIGRAHV